MYIRMEVHITDGTLDEETNESLQKLFKSIIHTGLYVEKGLEERFIEINDFEFEGD